MFSFEENQTSTISSTDKHSKNLHTLLKQTTNIIHFNKNTNVEFGEAIAAVG